MSKKNRQHHEPEPETPAVVDPVIVTAQSALNTLDEKETVFTAEIDRLTLLLSEQKSKLRKLHALRKQLNTVLGIETPEPTPAE